MDLGRRSSNLNELFVLIVRGPNVLMSAGNLHVCLYRWRSLEKLKALVLFY